MPLAAAAEMDSETARIIRNERRDHGEDRSWAIGLIAARLHVLTCTLRGEVLRAISLRKANDRVRKRFGRS